MKGKKKKGKGKGEKEEEEEEEEKERGGRSSELRQHFLAACCLAIQQQLQLNLIKHPINLFPAGPPAGDAGDPVPQN